MVGAILAVYAMIPTFIAVFAAVGVALGLKEIFNSIVGNPHDSFTENYILAVNIAKYTAYAVGFVCGGFLPVIIGLAAGAISWPVGRVLAKGLSYFFATIGVVAERIFDPAPSNTYILVSSDTHSHWMEDDKQLSLEGTHTKTLAQLESASAAKPSVITSSSSVSSSGSEPLPQYPPGSIPVVRDLDVVRPSQAEYVAMYGTYSGDSQSVQRSVQPFANHPHASHQGSVPQSTFAPAFSSQQPLPLGQHPATFLAAPYTSNPFHVPGMTYSAPAGVLPQPHIHPPAHLYPSSHVDGGSFATHYLPLPLHLP